MCAAIIVRQANCCFTVGRRPDGSHEYEVWLTNNLTNTYEGEKILARLKEKGVNLDKLTKTPQK
ncbi:MAG: hypothetical protein ABJA71_14840 [Ginsengibacter sp.]